MRILYVTTVGITMRFFTHFIKKLIDEGNFVDIATNEEGGEVPVCYREWGCSIYHIPTSRSPLKKDNIAAIGSIKKICREKNYEVVHCHTPVAAMCTRLACRSFRKKGMKVVYTAHGFHFFKGAPKKNWLLFYPIEKVCSLFTDVLVTINKEDYMLAAKKMRAKKIVYIPGVGIDVIQYSHVNTDRNEKRQAIGVPKDVKVLLSVGELNKNKNHEVIIRAMGELNQKEVHYVIVGKGELYEYLFDLSRKMNVHGRVHLLGYRNDVSELYRMADIFVHPSYREGLPVSVMEAMASGLPIIGSKIRGNVDLIEQCNGLCCEPNDVSGFAEAIQYCCEMLDKGNFSPENSKRVASEYGIETINEMLIDLYK